ncbi:VacJ family lipoprotein [Stenotrophomonas sp. HITSZ_GD]|uniref:MlaA family lipoprotein n=1 Tax=Stenotrophomonas sp. HITSZ_GD TaxID=3037248 RepID=UPI00240E6B2D|nr:VacJ family lipoprotein [Stenotrophomonas sp. HITSZ_GD]MDG2524091.1 VacJ family lipoprotein [Stenotrophomonas sp. HITSZ_GD]
MNVLRLPLLAAIVLLAACASQGSRTASAPSPGTPVPATAVPPTPAADAAPPPPPADNAPPTAPVEDTAASASVPPATDAGPSSAAPTQAEDDFAALYGGPAPAAGDTAASGGANAAAYDPWEGYNRKMHRFNLAIDRGIARPLANAYVNVTPQPVRLGVSNFFENLRSPLTMVNQLLQGHPVFALQTLGRFVMNSTLGIGGLMDPASAAKIPRRTEDFGQTLGVWGWSNSRYFELPLFGPRTVRDTFGLAGDAPLSPLRQVDDSAVRFGLQGLQLVNTRSQLLAVDALRDQAVDEYALTRDAWLQRRNYQIQSDRRGSRDAQDDGRDTTVPVDAMPIPNFGN